MQTKTGRSRDNVKILVKKVNEIFIYRGLTTDSVFLEKNTQFQLFDKFINNYLPFTFY